MMLIRIGGEGERRQLGNKAIRLQGERRKSRAVCSAALWVGMTYSVYVIPATQQSLRTLRGYVLCGKESLVRSARCLARQYPEDDSRVSSPSLCSERRRLEAGSIRRIARISTETSKGAATGQYKAARISFAAPLQVRRGLGNPLQRV
jgi:hypothetical protein